jgi:hypothetical protein
MCILSILTATLYVVAHDKSALQGAILLALSVYTTLKLLRFRTIFIYGIYMPSTTFTSIRERHALHELRMNGGMEHEEIRFWIRFWAGFIFLLGYGLLLEHSR